MSELLIHDPLFLSKISQTESGCWEWQGVRDAKGYGRMTRKRISATTLFAHRYAWFLRRAELPPSHLAVCHLCDNPPCVNPDHLFLGTLSENNEDMRSKGRDSKPPTRWGMAHHEVTVPDAQVRKAREDYAAALASQDEIAARLGIAQATVGAWLRGKTRVAAGGPINQGSIRYRRAAS